MSRSALSTLAAIAAVFVLGACGHTSTQVLAAPDGGMVSVQSATIAPVEIKSREDDAELLALNRQLAAVAADELKKLLASKKIGERAGADSTLVCRIAVTYGSRALRYWVGFGAGAGNVTVDLELKSAQGATLYAAQSRADLKVGAFGGDMSSVAKDAIAKAVSEFGARIAAQP